MFGRRQPVPPPTPPKPQPFPNDETLAVPEIAAAVALARQGNFEGVAEIHRAASSRGNGYRALWEAATALDVRVVHQWSSTRPGDPFAATLLGNALIHAGWEIRGSGRAKTVSSQQFEGFWNYLRAAEREFVRATEVDWPGVDCAWTGLVVTSRALQAPQEELANRYASSIAAGSGGLLELHEQMLQGVCKKWSGSHEAMFTFARSLADPSSPLPSNSIICLAHLERWIDGVADEDEPDHVQQPDVVAEIAAMAATAWLPGFPSDYDGLAAHNTFAVLLARSGDLDAAARHVRYLGPRVRNWPWVYLSKRTVLLGQLRERAAGLPS